MTSLRPLRPIHEQVVVVMGASSGIGREAALRFAGRGARVVISARSAAKLETLVREIEAAGGTALAVPADVSRSEEVQAVADRAVEAFGRIDTWVHCAGVGLWSEVKDLKPEEWAQVIAINLNGAAYAVMAAIPYLRREKGAFIGVSSSEGRVALPFQTAYGASKAGVHTLLRGLRLELIRDGSGVTVTEIMPSGTNTPIFSQARTKIGTKPRPPGFMYEPGVVVDSILHAAEHRTRQIVVGSSSRVTMLGQAISPGMMDGLILLGGTWTQHTEERKGPDAPTNLFQPIESEQRIRGDFNCRRFSVYNWLEMHPAVKHTLEAAAIGAVAVFLMRRRSS